MLAGLARIVLADAAVAFSLGADGTLAEEAVWDPTGITASGAVLGASGASERLPALARGPVRLWGREAIALSGHPEATLVPLRVEGEPLGLVVLVWRAVRPVKPSRSEEQALDWAGRYLGGAKRRVELARMARDAAVQAQRMGRILGMLSECNRAIIRAPARAELLNQVCMAAASYLDAGGRGAAAIGWMHDSGERFTVEHRAGGPPWLFDRLEAEMADRAPHGLDLVSLTLGSGEVQVAWDLAQGRRDSPLRSLALEAGMRSFAAARLRDRERVGVLFLFTSEPAFFAAADRELMGALAAAVTHGLNTLAAAERLREQEMTLEAVLDQAAEGIVVADAAGRIEQVNRTLAKLVGTNAPALVGQDLAKLVPAAGRARAAVWRGADPAECLRPGPASFAGEAQVRTADGSRVPVGVRLRAVDAPRGARLVATLRDRRETKAMAARLDHMALHDPLTGLWNRRGLSDRFRALAAEAKATGRPLGFALVDVDDFQSLNDVFGHRAGDQVLRSLSRRLYRAVGAGGLVARVGGDEFALVDILGDGRASDTWLARLLCTTDREIRFGSRQGRVGISVGVATMPDHGDGLEALFARAGLAMGSVKRVGGHGGRLFAPAIEHQQEEIRQVRDGLSQALSREQLLLHYQPQVDMLAHRVVGFEALLRWHDPSRGMRMPGEFLPLLHDEGLIAQIGNWVLVHSLADWAAWRSECPDLRLAVNVAPQWFLSRGFLDDVRSALAQVGIADAHHLELEITESAAMPDLERARANIAALHEMGIGVALDDFGTGYASLGYLNDLAVDSIKIDTSFTQRLLESSDSWSIMQAILLMAAGSELAIVAEGVESAAIAEAVLHLGVRIAQGYAFARPLPAGVVMRWARAFRDREGGALPHVGADALAGSGFLTAVYLHLRWMQRVVVAIRHPRALAGEDSLSSDTECRLQRWAAGHSVPVIDELVAAHTAHHQTAARLLRDRSRSGGPHQAEVAQFVAEQAAFFHRASTAFFAVGPAALDD